ncbi:MAG: hypothetical protein LQ340_000450 [Diploschistes diacapsis]|nr:MAG: hypothetical protein LQ340_000450 [Diploschistes diacapsis]
MASVAEEVNLVIQYHLKRLVQRGACRPAVRDSLKDLLRAKADAFFLWVKLVPPLVEKRHFRLHTSMDSELLDDQHGKEDSGKGKVNDDTNSILEYKYTLPDILFDGPENVDNILLADGFMDLNFQDGSGRTPLTLAAAAGAYASTVKWLLTHPRPNANLQGHSQSAPLYWAVASKSIPARTGLLEAPININHKDKYHRNVLSCAAESGNPAITCLVTPTTPSHCCGAAA